MEPVISLCGAVSVLGRFPALAGVDLSVDRGEIVALVGPNGAGKSTLLRLCAGLVGLAAGEGRVLGCDLRRERAQLRRRVGYLGHANGLYDNLTVGENVRFWAKAAGIAQPATASDAAMDRLAIAARVRDLETGKLSAGQRRRAALAALVVRRPELWLLDEPHAGLDAAARDQLDELIGEGAGAGVTVVVASHELDRVTRLCPRTVTVSGGAVSSPAIAPVPAPAPADAPPAGPVTTPASGQPGMPRLIGADHVA